MAFTEFYCQSGGSNLNAGSTTNNTAAYTSTNGSWSISTNIFTPTDGSTPSDFVSVGDFVSIYLDAATVAVFIARVTSVAPGANGGITVSTTSIAGTPPSTGATGRSLKAGGAWLGMNGSVTWPLNSNNFANLLDVNNNPNRLNVKNDHTYSITSALGATGWYTIQGYSSSLGDGGRATIDGGTSAINILTIGTLTNFVLDLILTNNASTGTNSGLVFTQNVMAIRITVIGMRGNGFSLINAAGSRCVECEAYNCNRSNSVNGCGFITTSQNTFYRCIAAGNTGTNTDGFSSPLGGATDLRFCQCISHGNGRHGFSILANSAGVFELQSCDSYNNGGDGFKNLNTTNPSAALLENCNFIKNAGYGINTAITTGHWGGLINNCGFGAGTMANGLGATNNLNNISVSGTVTYENDATPYQDPATGNFSLVPTNTLRQLGTGRGTFTETQGGFSGTRGYPDIGAAQHNADLLDEGVAGIGGA